MLSESYDAAASTDQFVEYLEPVDFSDVKFDQAGNVAEGVGPIERKVVCRRPVIRGIPNITSEQRGDKHIYHNYGHGGSGWTLLWGSVAKSIALFKQDFDAEKNPDLKTKSIQIIGNGVMGRVTSILLYELGFPKISVVADESEDIASNNASGYFAPVSLDTENEAQKKLVDEMGFYSYQEYKRIADGTHPLFTGGVRPLYVYSGAEKLRGAIDTKSGLEPYVEQGIIPPAEEGIVDFGNNQRHRMRRFKTFFMDTRALMQNFGRMMADRNIPITKGHIRSFDEIRDASIVFNCSGLGSRELNNDDRVYPVLGHLLALQNQPIEHMGYIIYTKYLSEPAATPEEKEHAPYVYFMPKKGGTVGGDFIPHEMGDNRELSEKAFRKMLSRSAEFFGSSQR